MNHTATDTPPDGQPLGLGLSEGLGPLPDAVQPVAYLYHDAPTAEDAHPWLHSSLLVLAADRRRTFRNETPLVTLAQAEAMVAAERESWQRIATNAQAVTTGCQDRLDYFEVPSHLMAALALALALDEGPNASMSRRG